LLPVSCSLASLADGSRFFDGFGAAAIRMPLHDHGENTTAFTGPLRIDDINSAGPDPFPGRSIPGEVCNFEISLGLLKARFNVLEI
jgi:hypothetical protein